MASAASDEKEDPSSSLTNELLKARDALEKLSIVNVQTDGDDELAAFRQQWQRELDATPSPQRELHQQTKLEPEENLSDEEKAKKLFLRGVELERSGKLYEAIQHYKRSIQIIPDVETRLYESTEQRPETPIEELVVEEVREVVEEEDSDDEMIEGEDLISRLQRILAKKGTTLCQPEFAARGAHMSWLPYEVIQLVLRWAVSADLDAVTLERISATCRGLYLAARENDIWRALCVKTWGIECGTPRSHGFPTWRLMYIDRPRIQLNGCYISKTTYLRQGENSYQDHSYRPWYLVDYYRYLRFFPDGEVLMWTTAEEPASCVAQLKHRSAKPGLGILAGHYRLVGDKVVIVIKKASSEKKPAQTTNTRFRSRRKETHEHHDQIFHLELELHNVRSRRNFQLSWRHYAVSPRRDQWTQFELAPSKFPPFAFSRVRAYTAEASAPLAAHA